MVLSIARYNLNLACVFDASEKILPSWSAPVPC